MTLPPALAARLKKRGIIGRESQQASAPSGGQDGVDGEEEVFAESYDDDVHSSRKVSSKQAGGPGCPNKINPFHVCVEYCWDHWGEGTPEARADKEYLRRRAIMLKKHPLPFGWKEVYDAGTGRYYYWNTESDEVCWLSPTHKRAVIGEAAPKLARAVFDKINRGKLDALARATGAPQEKETRKRRLSPPPPKRTTPSSDEEDDEDDTDVPATKRPDITQPKYAHGRKVAQRNDLDPMDPASYGECERGKWSSGLQRGDEAKTGVDTTASGPLYQMRPYPAPGAILRQQGKKKPT